MYAFLKGIFVEKQPTYLIVEIGGIGYEILISLTTYEHIQNLREGQLHIYEHIREDTHTLYGFFEKKEKTLFMELIRVSGISAHTARIMLSAHPPEHLTQSIINKDSKALERIKGIGKKTAERIILELNESLNKKLPELLPDSERTDPAPSLLPHQMFYDATQALSSLGIPKVSAEKALKQAQQHLTDKDLSLELLIKTALQYI